MSSTGPFPTSMAKVISDGAETNKGNRKIREGVSQCIEITSMPFMNGINDYKSI